MSNKATSYFLLCLILTVWVEYAGFAQTLLKTVDKKTREPLPGAHVAVMNQGKEVKFLVSDLQGQVLLQDVTYPCLLEVTFLGFKPFRYALPGQGEYTLELETEPLQLEGTVVTGQFEPQAIDESVFVMQSINKKRIEAQAAVNLADVLSNNLNITLRPSPGGDRTTLEMLGLDGRYIKVMVDGIPLVGIEGNGNDVDVTQINMSAIERVEIVEGPMSVNYGANASAGVINLITKKSASTKIDASVSVQEETVGAEYGWNKGRHIQTLGLGYRINDAFYTRLDYRHNAFKGLMGEYNGFNHQKNDDKRGFEWQPKEQHFGALALSYKAKWATLRYAYDFMDQVLQIPGHIVMPDEHPQTNIERPYSFDERYVTRRNVHKILANGHYKQKVTFNLTSSYSSVGRDETMFRKRISTGVEEEVIGRLESSYKTWLSRGNFSLFTAPNTPNVELGVEHNYDQILSSSIDGGQKAQHNLAFFANTEWKPVKKVTIRPGLRTAFNSVWKNPFIYSVNLKYEIKDNLDLRLYYGATYRTPNLTELYYYFVDANHDVQGNANLRPEDGYGYSVDVKHNTAAFRGKLCSSIKLFYNDIQNQITLGVVSEDPLKFQYINVDQFKSTGFTLTEKLRFSQLTFHAGTSLVGRLNRITSDNGEQLSNRFLFSPEYNFNMIYKITPKWDASIFYKRTGRREQLKLEAEDKITKGYIDAFDWLDIIVGYNLTSNLDVDLGVKNMLDLTAVNSTVEAAGAHSTAPTSRGLAYGRSYFVRLSYQFVNN